MLFSDGLLLVGILLVGMGGISYATIRKYRIDNNSKYKQIQQKNAYLEHAAKIIRHDMHSGIKTYIPRGVISLERKIPVSVIEEYKLGPSLRLLKEGLEHTNRVYDGVYAFTDLVKFDKSLPVKKINLGNYLNYCFEKTAYSDQVAINLNVEMEVNSPLFFTAIDNLVRNGLKYNDSKRKYVKIYLDKGNNICIEDNGRGLSSKDFLIYSKAYSRKDNQNESGSGLGLNIAQTILEEHDFLLVCQKTNTGTIMRIIKNE
jgi:signal transduction histidine kinase